MRGAQLLHGVRDLFRQHLAALRPRAQSFQQRRQIAQRQLRDLVEDEQLQAAPRLALVTGARDAQRVACGLQRFASAPPEGDQRLPRRGLRRRPDHARHPRAELGDDRPGGGDRFAHRMVWPERPHRDREKDGEHCAGDEHLRPQQALADTRWSSFGNAEHDQREHADGCGGIAADAHQAAEQGADEQSRQRNPRRLAGNPAGERSRGAGCGKGAHRHGARPVGAARIGEHRQPSAESRPDQLGPPRQPGNEQRDRQRRSCAQPRAPLRPRRIERQRTAHVTGNALDETHERFSPKRSR